MADIPIDVGIGLVSSWLQNNEAKRRQREADRLAQERLNESKRYRDSQVQRYNDLQASGYYNPDQRVSNLRNMFKTALDQNIGQINTQALATGRAGDSLPMANMRYIAEQNALNLANQEQELRDRLTMQQSDDLARFTNPAQYQDALGANVGYLSQRAKDSTTNPAALLMSAFANSNNMSKSYLDNAIANREYNIAQRANNMTNPFLSGGSNDNRKLARNYLSKFGRFH